MIVLLDMIKDLGYIDEKNYTLLKDGYDHLGRQINRLIQELQKEIKENRNFGFKAKT